MKLPNQAPPVNRAHSAEASANSAFVPSDYSKCVTASVNNQGQVCFTLPYIGSKCIPVSTPVPPGTSASACANICTTYGVPTGASATVTVLGQKVWSQSYGYC